MITTLTIIRYNKIFIPFALLAMAAFHFPLFFKKKIPFYKLMGCGKNGTFDKIPDLQQWAILTVRDNETIPEGKDYLKTLYGSFISKWVLLFQCEVFTFYLQPIKGHGTWDGKQPFEYVQSGNLDKSEVVATLTRATIRISKLKYFWQNVASAANSMVKANGFIFSAGVGEIPWIKQATFSIWTSEEAMTKFAYGTMAHANIVKKTRKEKWYSEDMFVRFKILAHTGNIKGIDPLQGKL